tara:strand:+ start:61 stop:378 length:318 start_codon:yes stop_codon:yes gene_type:complete
MKKEFIMMGLVMSGFAFSQSAKYEPLPEVEDISAVLGDDNQKYVVSLAWDEYYDPNASNFIGDYEGEIKRDTFNVKSKYPIGHLIGEDEWHEFKWVDCLNCDEVD